MADEQQIAQLLMAQQGQPALAPPPTSASWIARLLGSNGGAAFGALSPGEEAMRPPNVLDKAVSSGIDSLATLPQRAIDASTQDVQQLGNSDYQRQSIGPALETAVNMIGGAGAVTAEANTLRSGLTALREVPRNNYLGPISKHTDTLYREMSPTEALADLPTSVMNQSQGMGGSRKFYSDHPDLALGQGGNRGVKVEYDAAPFEGTINQRKPAWDSLFKSGMGEYEAAPQVGANIRDSVRRFEVDTNALSRVENAQYQRVLKNLEEKGWAVEKTEGKITAFAPIQERT